MTEIDGNSYQKKDWNVFVAANSGSFLQSKQWGDFHKKLGHKIYMLEGEHQDWISLAIKYNLPFNNSYLYIPRGPVFLHKDNKADIECFEHIKKIGREENCIFVRIEQAIKIDETTDVWRSILKERGFFDIGRSIQPKKNLIVPLNGTENELLANMHEKTRYNIRLAQRHKVTIFSFDESGQEETFWNLLVETANRQKITIYNRNYYRTMLETFCRKEKNSETEAFGKLYLAYYDNKPLAGAFIIFWGKRAVYLHGGSSLDQKNTMAPYLMHWEIMRDAKSKGITEYDMGGVDEQRWPGITRFKAGFGGFIEEYVNVFDAPISRIKYSLYNLGRKVLK